MKQTKSKKRKKIEKMKEKITTKNDNNIELIII